MTENRRHKVLHGKLKGVLIAGFLQKQEHRLQWIEQFKLHCKIEQVINGDIGGHFDYLEQQGLLQIGNYAVLKEMFEPFNLTALEVIDTASKEIQRVLQDNKNKNENMEADGTDVKNDKKYDNNYIKPWKY